MKSFRWACVVVLIVVSVWSLSEGDRFTGVWTLILALILKP